MKDNTPKNVDIDPDIKKEYINQRKYLESSHHSLQKRLEKEDQIHRQNNQNVMKDNIKLIKEIGDLRTKVSNANTEYKHHKNNLKSKESANEDGDGSTAESQKDHQQTYQHSTNPEVEAETLNSLRREADMKRRYIAQMQQTL